MAGKFDATHEWQSVGEGQSVPPGCHVRINMETGAREAKLLDREESTAGTQIVPADLSVGAPDPAAARPTNAGLEAAKEKARASYNKMMAESELAAEEDTSKTTEEKKERRTPHTWEGLLKWTLEHMDGTKPSNATPMDPARRKWLEEALSAMNHDEIALMKEALKLLVSNYQQCFDGTLTPAQLEEKEKAFEALHDLVDLIDNAQDLIPLGGYPAVISYLGCQYPSLVWRSLNVLATTVQNNPVCQQYCLAQGLLGRFMQLIAPENDPNVRVKALYALSALVRGNAGATESFVLGNGLGLLHTCLAAEGAEEKLAVKAAFILNQLMVNEDVSADTLVELDIVPTLLNLACRAEVGQQLREHCLQTLATLDQESEKAVDSLRAPELQAKQRLTEMQAQLKAMAVEEKDANEEQLAYLASLLALLG